MEPTEIHQTIAGQIDNTKPDDLKPGVDVGMEAIDANTLAVVLPKLGVRFDVRYDAGPDTYTVTRQDWMMGVWVAAEPISGLYCDQLGDLIFGEDAKPFTLPMTMISTDDGETWETIA